MIAAALKEFVAAHGSQTEIHRKTGLPQTTISAHIHNRRPVTGWHLMAYLAVATAEERPQLVAAWLRTYLPPDLASEILGSGSRIAESGALYAPALPDPAKRAIDYLAAEAAADPELADALVTFARHMGWPG